MSDLFSAQEREQNEALRPLADRMRPRDPGEFFGQQHLLGEGKPLRQAID
ncbi:MAG TPA: recombination factor protein RarA, partial [Gammaproteobacteria bacterium]